jgi:transposase
VLSVEDWAEIRRLHFAEGLGIKTIAKRLGVARNTVRMAVRSGQPPAYRRPKRRSVVDAYEDQIRALLKNCPTMPATVIAERIGWPRGITILKERVAELRPLYRPQDPYQRTDYRPGELAQWDLWEPPVDIPVGYGHAGRFQVIVGVSGYSRFTVARMIPTKETCDVLAGHLACLVDLGGVPRTSVYDNEAAIGRNRKGEMHFTQAFVAFKGTVGMGAVILKGGFPEGKGLVERTNGYLERSFLPGRRFASMDDFNEQLTEWLTTANSRDHRTIRCRPSDRIREDLGSMLALPPLLPDVCHRSSIRVGRDHYVRFATCDYSVHPRAIGRRAELKVDLDWVVVTCAGDEVARHRRSLAPHRTITDPAHSRARRALKETNAAAEGASRDIEVEVRDLVTYDHALGVA